eukprot:CAMPEP_0118976804 /NCGR_PEP_ID=MMETSP1173-20130426/19753_1 /TAXON_ID=1034831 /ORGANISM="Rhizochromulina marina cf, Strain CCMP1243" /LENGTH=180 /DNA_ID=CAMNT_0006926865 /DNA_START=147 /DNA_END=686 /DNA_ORIENTATION=+
MPIARPAATSEGWCHLSMILLAPTAQAHAKGNKASGRHAGFLGRCRSLRVATAQPAMAAEECPLGKDRRASKARCPPLRSSARALGLGLPTAALRTTVAISDMPNDVATAAAEISRLWSVAPSKSSGSPPVTQAKAGMLTVLGLSAASIPLPLSGRAGTTEPGLHSSTAFSSSTTACSPA